MLELNGLTTEQRNPQTLDLDAMSTKEFLRVMNDEDQKVALAVREELDDIELASDLVVTALSDGGRLIYMGAGTSGRLGLLDAVECPPTFGTAPEVVVGLVAGGEKAFIKAAEGAEDSEKLAMKDLKAMQFNEKDVLIGIAASGRTPYCIGGFKYAKQVGARTVSIACNKHSKMGNLADVVIEVDLGPEVLTGSTRLKSGTAQKLILNMISTGAMIRIGKVYQNFMVDVQQTNEKLCLRAQNIVMDTTHCSRELAISTLDEADGSVKLAIVMILLHCTKDEAIQKLVESKGHIRQALK